MDSTVASIVSTLDSGLGEWRSDVLWILIVGFVVAFFLAFGVGANDVANQFGTSVGAKVISLRNACILATIFELLGAVLIGSRVSDTIRKKIIDLEVYEDSRDAYLLGNLSALGASAIWLIVATFFKMPISGTHSIVGSVLGFSLVEKGLDGISWWELAKIVASWFISPVLSGGVSGLIFFLISKFILKTSNPIRRGLLSLPIFYGITVLINIASVLVDGPDFLTIKTSLPDWTEPTFGVVVAIAVGLCVAGGVAIWLVPYLRRQIDAINANESKTAAEPKDSIFIIGQYSESSERKEPINKDDSYKNENQMVTNTFGFIPELNHNLKVDYENEKNPPLSNTDGTTITPNSSGAPLIETDPKTGFQYTNGLVKSTSISDEGITFSQPKRDQEDSPGVIKLFSFLQILTAAFGSFVHGGNDVSNAIGPLIALYLVYEEGIVDTKASTPIWILIFGGVGISAGLWVWGRRVIKTMGEDLTKITPSSGFTIEIGAALTVLMASKLGLPVSTTHCKVGSVVSVGWIKSTKQGVDWSLFRNIVFAWLVTLPISAGLSALLMWILQSVYL